PSERLTSFQQSGARRIVSLAGANSQIGSPGSANADPPEPAVSAFIGRIVTQQVLSLKLVGNLAKHGFQVRGLLRYESLSSGLRRHRLHEVLSSHADLIVQGNRRAARIDRVKQTIVLL